MAPGGRRRQAGADGRAESARSGAAPPRRVRAGPGRGRGGARRGDAPLDSAIYRVSAERTICWAEGRRGGEGRGAGVGPGGAPSRGRCLSAPARGPRRGWCGGAQSDPCVGHTHACRGTQTRGMSPCVCVRSWESRLSRWTDPSPRPGGRKIPPGLVPPVFLRGGAHRSLRLNAKLCSQPTYTRSFSCLSFDDMGFSQRAAEWGGRTGPQPAGLFPCLPSFGKRLCGPDAPGGASRGSRRCGTRGWVCGVWGAMQKVAGNVRTVV